MSLKLLLQRATFNKYFLLVVGLSLSIIFFFPILLNIHAFGIQDWDQNFAWSEFSRAAITQYNEFPLWNPYRCGGSPHFANPEISVVSIQTIFVLLLGTVVGIKISTLFHSILGFIGFYLLSRYYKISHLGSLLASVVFTFSGITGSFLSTGMVVFISYTYSPYILLTYLCGEKKRKYLILSSFLFSLSFYHGYHISLLLLFYLVIYTIIKTFRDKNAKHIINLSIFGILFILFSLPKLLPALHFVLISSHTIHDFSGFTIPQLFYFLLSHRQNLFGDMSIAGYTYGIDENSLYVGILPFLLFCLFFLKNSKQVRKHLVLILLLVSMLILMFGNQINPSLYHILKKLPFFSSFRVAQRFRFDFIILFALFVGMGMDRLLSLPIIYKYRRVVFLGIFLFVFIDLMVFNQENFLSKTLIIKETGKKSHFQFKQKASYSNIIEYYPEIINKKYEYTKTFEPWSTEYTAIQNNIGVIDCSYTLTGSISALPDSDPHYKGEWYTQGNSQKISVILWTPQDISFSLQPKDKSVTKDIFILNQNYFPGWYVKKGTILVAATNTNGLISTVIHGEKKIQFIYMPYRALGEILLKHTPFF